MIWIEQIVRWLVACALQVLLFNHLHFMGLIAPFVYIYFFFGLPATIKPWGEMLLGFGVGLLMDIFMDSLGVHTMACTTLVAVRPLLLGYVVSDKERLVSTIDMRTLGMGNYLKYIIPLVLLHHTMVFCLSAWSLHNWWFLLLQILLSSALTIGLIFVWEVTRS